MINKMFKYILMIKFKAAQRMGETKIEPQFENRDSETKNEPFTEQHIKVKSRSERRKIKSICLTLLNLSIFFKVLNVSKCLFIPVQ